MLTAPVEHVFSEVMQKVLEITFDQSAIYLYQSGLFMITILKITPDKASRNSHF